MHSWRRRRGGAAPPPARAQRTEMRPRVGGAATMGVGLCMPTETGVRKQPNRLLWPFQRRRHRRHPAGATGHAWLPRSAVAALDGPPAQLSPAVSPTAGPRYLLQAAGRRRRRRRLALLLFADDHSLDLIHCVTSTGQTRGEREAARGGAHGAGEGECGGERPRRRTSAGTRNPLRVLCDACIVAAPQTNHHAVTARKLTSLSMCTLIAEPTTCAICCVDAHPWD